MSTMLHGCIVPRCILAGKEEMQSDTLPSILNNISIVCREKKKELNFIMEIDGGVVFLHKIDGTSWLLHLQLLWYLQTRNLR